MRPLDTEELLKEIISEKMVEEFETEGKRTSPTPCTGWAVPGERFSATGFDLAGYEVHTLRGAQVLGPGVAGGHRDAGA